MLHFSRARILVPIRSTEHSIIYTRIIVMVQLIHWKPSTKFYAIHINIFYYLEIAEQLFIYKHFSFNIKHFNR